METEKEDGTKNYQGDAWEDEDIMVDEDVSEQDHPADYFFQDPKEHSATNNSQYDSTIGSQYADQQDQEDDCNAFVIRGSAASTSFRKSNDSKTSHTTKRKAPIPSFFRKKDHENNTINTKESRIQELEDEVHLLKEEKKALQEASRRLSEELGHNFQQVTDFETKEKKIADLIHKNQKLSHLLEKEIADKNQKQQTQEQLELQEIKQKEQIDLLNRVLSSVEAKNVALTESNTTLLQNYTNATSVIEKLQLQIQNLQFSSNFSSSEDIVIAYEKRLEEWEIKYSEVRKKLDSTIHELEKKKSKVEELNQVVKVLLLSKETLEKEIAQAQDEMISMNVSLKRHEAKIEVLERALSERQPMPTCKSKIIYQNDHTQEMAHLMKEMEVRLELQDRELHALPSFQPSQIPKKNSNKIRSMKRPKSAHASSYRSVHNKISRTVTNNLTDIQGKGSSLVSNKLQQSEEHCEKKTRSIEVLARIVSSLLQALDLMQEKFQVASESNEILSRAFEEQRIDGVYNIKSTGPTYTKEQYLALARQSFILSSPYDVDDLHGVLRLFLQLESMNYKPSRRAYAPFRVQTLKRANELEYVTNDYDSADLQMLEVVPSDPKDSQGIAFLQRSKLNLFLQFIQGKVMKPKMKELLFNKIAELMSKQRDTINQHHSEVAAQQSTILLLHKEIEELKLKLRRLEVFAVDHPQQEHSVLHSKSKSNRSKLLEKILSLSFSCKAKVLPEERTPSKTFLTETSSDVLILSKNTKKNNNTLHRNQSALDLRDCGLDDEDIIQVISKIQDCSDITELRLDGNQLSDASMRALAVLISQSQQMRLLSITDTGVTSRGIEILRQGIRRNSRVHRVVTLEGCLEGLGAVFPHQTDEVERETAVLRVILPEKDELSKIGEAEIQDIICRARQTLDKLNQSCSDQSYPFSAVVSAVEVSAPSQSFNSNNIGKKVRRPLSASAVSGRGSSSHQNDLYSSLQTEQRHHQAINDFSSHAAQKNRPKSAKRKEKKTLPTAVDVKYRALEAALANVEAHSEFTRKGKMFTNEQVRQDIINSLTQRGRFGYGGRGGRSHVATVRELKR